MAVIPLFLRELYPFESHFLDLTSPTPCRLHYVDAGQGEPVVLLHGNPTWSFYYRQLIQTLRPHFRCLALDHIGCGLSDKPYPYPYCLQQHIDNTAFFLQSLHIDAFHLIVHDWGGAIGMGVAVNCPSKIRSLTILNSAAFLSKDIPLRIALLKNRIGSWSIRRLNVFAKAATWMAVKRRRLPNAIKRGYLYPYLQPHQRVAIDAFVQDIPMSPEHPTYAVMQAIQNKLHLLQDKPCLLAWGMRDFCFTKKFFDRWKSYFPQAIEAPFQQAGHYVLEDAAPEIQNTILNFLLNRPQINR